MSWIEVSTHRNLTSEKLTVCSEGAEIVWSQDLCLFIVDFRTERDYFSSVFAGHNFGSEHDPNTAECAPGGDMGRYIMYPASVSGRKTNNNVCTLSTFCFYLYRSWHSNPATNIGAHSRELRYMHVSLGGFYLSHICGEDYKADTQFF